MINAQTIVARANGKTNIKFYKSYVKRIRLEDKRPIKDHHWFACECDYSFEYKGKCYLIIDNIVPDEKGDKRCSMKHEYDLFTII